MDDDFIFKLFGVFVVGTLVVTLAVFAAAIIIPAAVVGGGGYLIYQQNKKKKLRDLWSQPSNLSRLEPSPAYEKRSLRRRSSRRRI